MSATRFKRRRARKACTPCHQRKRKCDGAFPCGMCNTYDYDCTYGEGNIAVSKKSSRDSTLTNHLTGLESPADTDDRTMIPTQNTVTVLPATSISNAASTERMVRYVGSPASMTFPHSLGADLGSISSHHAHSLAYNFGTRPDESSESTGSLAGIVSQDDLVFYSNVFFAALGAVCDLLDSGIYMQRCQDYYRDRSNTGPAFGAVAAGVVALGSSLCPNHHPREAELVQYAKQVLEEPAAMRILLIDQAIAWGLRVIYLRATSRPNNAWFASCTALHLCEAIGLHDDKIIQSIVSADGAAALGHSADRLRRVFWVIWSGHHLISYEFDRSPVHLRFITCGPVMPLAGSLADQFVHLAQFIPVTNSPYRPITQASSAREELFERLRALNDSRSDDAFLQVTKIDIALCFYRRIYQLKTGISDEAINVILDCGQVAMTAARQLAQKGSLFWNVIGSVFHFACALLAMDTPAASVHIGSTFELLEDLVKTANTAATRDALSMAQHLLDLLASKKREELKQLENIQANDKSYRAPAAPMINDQLPDIEWNSEWDQFLLDPYFPLYSHEFQT